MAKKIHFWQGYVNGTAQVCFGCYTTGWPAIRRTLEAMAGEEESIRLQEPMYNDRAQVQPDYSVATHTHLIEQPHKVFFRRSRGLSPVWEELKQEHFKA